MKGKMKKILSILIIFLMTFTNVNLGLVKNNKVLAEGNNAQVTTVENVTVNDATEALIQYFNEYHFKEKQGKLIGLEYSAMVKAGADLSKKQWDINEQVEYYNEKVYKKVEQSAVLMDLGKDPTNYNGVNLVKEIADDLNNKSSVTFDDLKAIVLLDKYNEKFKEKKFEYDAQKLIKNLVSKQKDTGCLIYSQRNTAYAINALSRHKDVEGVENCTKKAIKYLQDSLQNDGGIYGREYLTDTHLQIITQLADGGVDLKDKCWAKDKDVITALFNSWNGKYFVKGENIKDDNCPKGVLYCLATLKEKGYGDYVLNGVKFEEFKKENPSNPEPEQPQKQGSTINSTINAVIDYYNEVHFITNQGQLEPFEYSAMYRAGADLKKKSWCLVEKYQTNYDKEFKGLGSKVHQSTILLDVDKNPNNYEDRKLVNEIAKEVDENTRIFTQIDIQAVITLDKYNEKFKNNKVNYNVQHAVEAVLKAQCDNGGFKERKDPVPINTGYAIKALSKHKEIKGVNEAINKGIEYLHKMQKDDGSIYETTFVTGYNAEIISGLIAVGEDLKSEKWTKSSGKNPIDALFTLWKDNNSFDGKKGESTNNRGWVEATWKALYTLVDLKQAGYGDYVVQGVKVSKIGNKDTDNDPEEKTCKVNVAIVLPKAGGYDCKFTPKEVVVSDKKHKAGFTALGTLQAATSLYEMSGKMVTSIYGDENKGLNGWVYSVNDILGSKMAEDLQVKEGDKVIWYYSMGGMDGKIPTWYELTGQKISVEGISLDKQNLTLNKGEAFKLIGTVIPQDATNKNVKWLSSDPKVAIVDNDGNIAAIKEGQATITVTTEEGAKVAKCNVEVKAKEVVKLKDYSEELNKSIESVSKIILKGEICDWHAVALSALNKEIPDSYLKNITEKIKNRDKDLFDVDGKFDKTTDCERTIIGIVAAGGNPSNIGNYNLLEDLYSRELSKENKIYDLGYGLIALDAGRFNLTNDAKFTREQVIEKIIANQIKDEGWGFGSTDIDTTAMVLAPLSSYVKDAKVKASVDTAVEFLSKRQSGKGLYLSQWNPKGSSESVSQTIIAICALGIDPTCDKFTKNGNNLLDALFSFKTKDGGFAHSYENLDKADPMATTQAFEALAAYKKFKDGKTGSIYLFKDEVKDVEKIEVNNLTNVKEFKLGSEAKITVQATNNTDQDKDATLIVVLYDNNGKMINYVAGKQVIKARDKVELEGMMKLPISGNYNVKVFVWDSFEEMKPLSNVITIPVVK